ncbi:MAG: malto-oligosyltrehalose trehalohydrolase [Verrucomicrobiales bacterium]|nr:malto-oligosyltrehalose trehalohydrolase [Verrucomicrobiales bacterium]
METRNGSRIGVVPVGGGESDIRVWVPAGERVEIEIEAKGSFELANLKDGYFGGTVKAAAGDRYRFKIDNGSSFPDPVSLFQPYGVHGPSEIIDHSRYEWCDENWKGVDRDSLVIYEIHVGTFTPEGTFRSAIERVDELVDLGVTALEIMPVAQAPGRWNWGYDAVNLFAPSHNYGHPDDMKALVDACHAKGLAVILDVVYNHIGPEGNYMANYGPYFSKNHRTPWGDAFNFDEDFSTEVRNYIKENVRYWIEDFHLDGLRLDAINLMADNSKDRITHEIARYVDDLRERSPRILHLIGETCVYDPELIEKGYDGVWSDEIPHAILSIVLNQTKVAERVYNGFADLEICLEKGFLYQWQEGEIRRCRTNNRASYRQIIQGLQTHDQVGNHPLGHRIGELAGPAVQRASAALTLLYPAIPFIFMGEEFATPSPFCFFVDFGDHWLRDAVIAGRKREYGHHDWQEFISPLDEDTYLRSKLPSYSEGDELTLKWYRSLLQIRKEWLAKGIIAPDHFSVESDSGTGVVTLRYKNAWVTARLGDMQSGCEDEVDLEGEVLLHSRNVTNGISSLAMNEAAVGYSG